MLEKLKPRAGLCCRHCGDTRVDFLFYFRTTCRQATGVSQAPAAMRNRAIHPSCSALSLHPRTENPSQVCATYCCCCYELRSLPATKYARYSNLQNRVLWGDQVLSVLQQSSSTHRAPKKLRVGAGSWCQHVSCASVVMIHIRYGIV